MKTENTNNKQNFINQIESLECESSERIVESDGTDPELNEIIDEIERFGEDLKSGKISIEDFDKVPISYCIDADYLFSQLDD